MSRIVPLLASLAAAILLAIGVAVFAALEPAQAAFPGQNGDIFFSRGFFSVWRMKPDGSEKTKVAEETSFIFRDLAWSADGTKFAYNSSKKIFSRNADGTNPINIAPGVRGFKMNPSWYPNGRKVAFGAQGDIYVTTLRANGQPRGEPTKLTHNASIDGYPAVSPDGKKIAFSRQRLGNNKQIYVMKANVPEGPDNRPVPLTNSGGGVGNIDADWSPNGKRITFVSDRRTGGSEVFVMNADGTEETRLTKGGNPTFSPDGKSIAFDRDVGGEASNVDIYVMDADDPSSRVNLTNEMVDESGSKTWELYPAWQPVP